MTGHRTIGGYRTSVLRHDGAGPPLLLLHGFGDSAGTWRPLLQRLKAAGRAATAPDLPGFGRADRLTRSDLLTQWDAFVAAAVRDCARRHGAPPVVAGNSLGGLLALRAASRPGLPIAGVVGVAPGGLARLAWTRLLTATTVLAPLLALPVPVPRRVLAAASAEVYVRLAFSEPAAADPEVVRSFAAHLADRGSIARTLAIGRRLVSEVDASAWHAAAISRPLLVLWGTRDRMVPVAGAAQLGEAVPGARVELLDGCGHCPQVERPDEVMAVLGDWLAGLSGEAPARRSSR